MIRISPVIVALAAMFPPLAHADAPLWGPHIDIEAKPGSKRTLGEADLFLPLSQDARTLVFANLRARFDNQTSREGNLGLGVRHMLEGGWNLGAYGYADRRRSPDSGHYYNQVTLGAEALGRDWDLRANTYLPSGTRVRELSSSTAVGVPTAAVVGAAIQVTTPGNITTTREERALKGYDMEMGWRAPIFDSEAARQLRFYVGGYRFSDDVITVEGPRLRAELAVDDLDWFGKGTRLFLGLEAQHDSARGHQNFLSVRLRIPLGKASAASRALSAQERRMTAPVMRDVDVVTNARTVSTSTPTVVETTTATAGGQTITVLDSATTSGAALQGALDAAAVAAGGGANSTVILTGTFDTSAGNGTTINLNAGQTLMGTGTLTVRSPSGRTATLAKTSTATITGTYDSGAGQAIIAMADNSTLTGMTLRQIGANGGAQYGVYVNGKTGVVISNNTISNTNDQSYVWGAYLASGGTATLSGNSITVHNYNGGGAYAWGVRIAASSATVTGNTITATSNSGAFYTSSVHRSNGNPGSPSAFASGSTGNRFTTSAGCTDDGSTRSGTLYYTDSTGASTSCQ